MATSGRFNEPKARGGRRRVPVGAWAYAQLRTSVYEADRGRGSDERRKKWRCTSRGRKTSVITKQVQSERGGPDTRVGKEYGVGGG